MKPPKAPIISTDSMEVVMKKFDQTGAWNLPVVDEDNKYIGVCFEIKNVEYLSSGIGGYFS